MAFKMKGFSGFKQTQDQKRAKTTKDIMSPAGFEAVKKRQISDSYAKPGGDPKYYKRLAKLGDTRQAAIDKKNAEQRRKAILDIEIDYSQGVKSGKYKNPYKK
jgi:hypothetical protein